MELQQNKVSRQFKCKKYRVLYLATTSETLEQLVIYQALYGDYEIFARPLEMFISKVDKERYPDASQEYRFECIE